VKDIIQFMNLKADRVEHVEDRAFNEERYRIDSSKLLDLGWRQEVRWEVGLEVTIDWYGNKQNLERWPSWRSGLVPHPQPRSSCTARVYLRNANLITNFV